MKFEIKSRFSGAVLFSLETESIKLCVEAAVKSRADLRGANLGGAKLADDLTLVGERPVFTLGPIGSRADLFIGYVTNQGLRVRAGCFFGAPEEFTSALEAEHGTNAFAREYLRALELLELHAELYQEEKQ